MIGLKVQKGKKFCLFYFGGRLPVIKCVLLVQPRADPVLEEVPPVSFQSKYIHRCKYVFLLADLPSSSLCWCSDFTFSLSSAVPLYQDYNLRTLKDDLNRLDKGLVSELITPQYLQGLQSPLCSSGPASRRQSPAQAAAPSSPAHLIKVTPCSLWQDLDEVKASGLLRNLTSRQIRLQEVRESRDKHGATSGTLQTEVQQPMVPEPEGANRSCLLHLFTKTQTVLWLLNCVYLFQLREILLSYLFILKISGKAF